MMPQAARFKPFVAVGMLCSSDPSASTFQADFNSKVSKLTPLAVMVLQTNDVCMSQVQFPLLASPTSSPPSHTPGSIAPRRHGTPFRCTPPGESAPFHALFLGTDKHHASESALFKRAPRSDHVHEWAAEGPDVIHRPEDAQPSSGRRDFMAVHMTHPEGELSM